MRKISVLLITVLLFSFCQAQFNISAVSTNYSQDFNTLTNGTWTDNTTLTGWYTKTDATASITSYSANTGTTTAGALYAFGVTGTNPLSDRALGYGTSNGFTGTAGTQKGYLGWRLKNNTGSAISSITVTWTGEQWRKEANSATHNLELFYQTGTTVTNLTAGTWTAAPSVFTSPVANASGATALDGNATANRVANISVTITVTIASGDEIMLRWEDLNDTGSDHLMGIDDITVNAAAGVTNTITTTTVSSPPFTLANCSATATGTVDFTSTDVFNGGNVFTAQLSDNTGSFAAPVAIGTLSSSGTGPSGTINITIPAGTASGANYKIRVVSSNPVVTGSESVTFTITQLGTCSSSATDYYRSAATGNWGSASTWESSPDNTNWINATMVPTSAANTITIQSPHVVTVAAAASADQLIVQSGATLTHSAGTFTVDDGTGDDIDVQSGGIFILATNSLSPAFGAGSPTINIANGGLLRISGTGLTPSGGGVNANNYVYQNQSILEYTLNSTFAASGVTFFPNANASTIPIFRITNSSLLTVGGSSATIINGVFQSNGAGGVAWSGTGTKTFRNGITGTGSVSDAGTSGAWIINGTTAELGGAGTVTLPTGGLSIGTSTDVTMTSDKTVIGDITILSGSYITLGSFNLSNNGTITGGTTNYVKTNGIGALILVNVTGAKNAPIGNSTYNPLIVNNTSGHNWTLRVEDVLTVDDPLFASNVAKAVLREWHITPSVNPPSTGAAITFQWDDSDPSQVGALYNNAENVQVWHEVANGNPWGNDWIAASVSQVATGTPPGIRTASISNWSWYSPFAVSNISGPLPLKLISFDVQKINVTTARLTWELAGCCLPGAKFELEKSFNGTSFGYISTIEGSTTSRFYTSTDAMGGNRAIYYRLKMIDADGKTTYSRVVAVVNDKEGIIITAAYPNPVTDNITISISAAKSSVVSFEIISLSGVVIKRWPVQLSAGTNSIQADTRSLAAGIYYLKAIDGENKSVLKLIKQ